jgi:RHS repeat-associated protein
MKPKLSLFYKMLLISILVFFNNISSNAQTVTINGPRELGLCKGSYYYWLDTSSNPDISSITVQTVNWTVSGNGIITPNSYSSWADVQWSTPGTYTVQVSLSCTVCYVYAGFDCYSDQIYTATYQVNVLNEPNSPTAVSEIISPTSVRLNVQNPASGYSYRWYDANNALVATGNSYVATVSAGFCGSKSYSVAALAYGCESAKTPINACFYPTPTINSSTNLLAPAATATLTLANAGSSACYTYTSYEWRRNGQVVGTAPTLTVGQAQIGNYTVKVGVGSCAIESALFSLKGSFETTDMNYVLTNTVRKRGITSLANLDAASLNDFDQNIGYLDNLGRPTQSVAVKASPSFKDIIQPIEYDVLGREAKKYQAYTGGTTGAYTAQATALSNQATFYNTAANVSQTTAYPYAETRFETSPLSRPLEQGSVGAVWQIGTNKTAKSNYRSNVSTDNIRIWNYTTGANGVYGTITSNAFYPAGGLQIIESRDEYDRLALTFSNRAGQKILMRVRANIIVPPASTATLTNLDTYYVYDDLGNLRATLPPQTIKLINDSGLTNLTYDPANTGSNIYNFVHPYVYRTHYDNRNRPIEQYLPNVLEPVVTVYDVYDRPIMTQDGEQRVNNIWSFAKYDRDGRSILSGDITYSGVLTRAELQQAIDTYYNGITASTCANTTILPYEVRQATGTPTPVEQGYTRNQAYPCPCIAITNAAAQNITITNYDLQKVSYYDDYDFDNNGTADVNFIDYTINTSTPSVVRGDIFVSGNAVPKDFNRLRGATTGSRVKILNPDLGMPTWLRTVSFYDNQGQVIQIQADNHLGGTDVTTTQYAFDGRVLVNHLRHTRSGVTPPIEISKRPSYDVNGRVLANNQRIGKGVADIYTAPSWESWQTLARFTYNEAGELTKKDVGADAGNSNIPTTAVGLADNLFLQNINYTYNERGWLKSINQMTLDATNNDLFGMEFFYNDVSGFGLSGVTATSRYDGNVAAIQWKSKSDDVLRGFAYQYTDLDQLDKADYAANGALAVPGENFSLSGMRYDLNGNIVALNQHGLKQYNQSASGSTVGMPTFSAGATPIDQLAYDYTGKGNQLRTVTDNGVSSGQAGDFRKITTGTYTDQYIYNFNGNLKQDLNKGIDISYNTLDRAKQIDLNAGNYTGYKYYFVYDAVGNKLRTTLKDGSSSIVTQYDYIGDMVYVGDGTTSLLQSIETDEGRILATEFDTGFKTGGTINNKFVYEYFYRDHLGNTRLVYRKDPGVPSYKAGMETANSVAEESIFKNIAQTRVAGNAKTGSNSAKLTNTNFATAPTQPMGPLLSLQVSKGDIINANVFAKLATATQTATNLSQYLTIQVQNSGQTPVSPGSIDRPINEKTGLAFMLGVGIPIGNQLDPSDNPTTGKAYLRYIFYSKNGDYLDSKTVALGTQTTYTQLTLPAFTASEEGYIQIFVANESNKVAYFDDLTITLNSSPIYQENHYSPMGLNLVGIEKPGRPEHRWQYQGKEKLHEAGLMYYDFGSRQYDAQLGRWHATDPQNQFDSPYNAMGNNWANGVDPNGEFTYAFAQMFKAFASYVIQKGSQNLNAPKWLSSTLNMAAGMLIDANITQSPSDFGKFTSVAPEEDPNFDYVARAYPELKGLTAYEYKYNVDKGELSYHSDLGGRNTHFLSYTNNRGLHLGTRNVTFRQPQPTGLVSDYISNARRAFWGATRQIVAGFSEYGSNIPGPIGRISAGINFLATGNYGSLLGVIPFDKVLPKIKFGIVDNIGGGFSDDLVKIRHHTSKSALKSIKKSKTITASRGEPYGVDFEVGPFVKPSQANFGQFGRGAYVELTVPRQMLSRIPGYFGAESGNGARIVTDGLPLDISNFSPKFKVWKWW